MIVVIDSKNPFLAAALAPLCEVRVLPTGQIERTHLLDADAVIVRSETQVGAGLLDGTRVRFVGTATIGTDHVDIQYLAQRGISFASAPGSNANSVAEYVAAALLVAAGRTGRTLRGSTIGIVGAGNVGSKTARVARALGMTVVLNDPPLERTTGDARYRPLDELMDADVVSLHVPLTHEGQDATHHLWDAARIRKMKKGSLLLNTSRGAVVDTAALHGALLHGHLAAAVLDVWEHEPAIDAGLLGHVLIGTPHIAGYSLDGKINAARMMYDELIRHFGLAAPWSDPTDVPVTGSGEVAVHAGGSEQEIVRGVVTRCYDVEQDDTRLRVTALLAPEERAQAFRGLRSGYPVRREFAATTVRCDGARSGVVQTLRDLGFPVVETARGGLQTGKHV
jgi:erythronate-4-phosphate dehydrogenase